MKTQIKILVVNPTGILGGGTKISETIIRFLQKRNFEFLVFFPEKGGAVNEFKKNVPLIEKFVSPGVSVFQTVLYLKVLIKKVKPDIIHAHGTRAAFWVRIALMGLKDKPKLIYTLHGFHIIRRSFFLKWLLVLIERFLNRWTDVLVCVSEADKKLVLKYQTIFPEKIKVIKNGIDIEKFQTKRELIEKTRKELGLEDRFILTSIARLHPPKDISTILQALKLIIPKIKNVNPVRKEAGLYSSTVQGVGFSNGVKLLIVGDGPSRGLLEKEVEDLNLSEHVKFLGCRENTPVLINLSDIVVLSTKWEGLPLVPLEAGASQKPIIASNIDGIREVIVDEKTGLLFKLGSPKDLADKILILYKNKKLRKEMGERGYQFVSQNFSKQRMIQEYQKLYQEILQ